MSEENSSKQPPEKSSIKQGLLELVGPAFGSVFRSLVLLSLTALVSGFFAWRVASRTPGDALAQSASVWMFVKLGIVGMVFLGCAGIAPLFAIKRALLTALLHGVRRSAIGRRTVLALFERMLSISKDSEKSSLGERGSQLTKTVERLPLGQAEQRLREAISGLERSAAGGGASGFFFLRLHRLLIAKIEALTLSRFRAAGSDGVDLLQVRDELAEQADQTLANMLIGARRKLTILFLGGIFLGAQVFSYCASYLILIRFLARHGGVH